MSFFNPRSDLHNYVYVNASVSPKMSSGRQVGRRFCRKPGFIKISLHGPPALPVPVPPTRWPARHHTNGRFRVWQPRHPRRLTEVAGGSTGL